MKTSSYWLPLLIVCGIALCSQSPDPSPADTVGGSNAAADALCQKAELFSGEEQYDSALIYAREAAEVAEQAKDWDNWRKSQETMLLARYGLGQYAEAAATFPALEQKAREVIPPDNQFWGDYYNNAGAIFNMLGNYEAALKYGLKEIAFEEKSGKPANLITACNNIGVYYRGRGDYDRALEYTQTALKVCLSETTTNPSDVAWTYANLSKIWYRKKDFPQAVSYAEKALAILEKDCPDELLSKIQTYLDLDNAYFEAKAYDKALAYLQKALQIHEQYKINDQIEFTWNNLGYVYAMMGRYGEATFYLKRAVERGGSSHPIFGKACRELGFVTRQQGDLRGALYWQQEALRFLADSFPYQDILANPAAQRVNAYRDFLFTLRDKGETLQLLAQKEGNPAFLEASLATFDVAAGVLDSMRAEYQEGSQQFWNREAHPIMESAIGIALTLYKNTGTPRYLEQAFRYAEKSKALLLAEALRESADRQQAGIPDTLLKEEKQLKIDIAFYKMQIFREQQKPLADTSHILLWQSEILQLHRAYDALLAKLEAKYPEYYQIKYRHPALTVTGVQHALPAGTGLLEYFQGDQGTYAFYIDATRALGIRLTADSSFTEALSRLIDGLRDRNKVIEQGRNAAVVAQFAKDANFIYRTLVASAVDEIPQKLIIIPDGNLAYLPFELLLTQDTSSPAFGTLPYLIRQTAVRYEYSAGLALQAPLHGHPSRFFAGYAPAYGGNLSVATTRGGRTDCNGAEVTDFAPLGNNQREVTQIAELLGGQAFLGEKATETEFRQQAQAPRIIHLAMHGFLNDCDPLYSGLVFSRQNAVSGGKDSISEREDGFLHAYEIYNMHLNAELAVLSACNTGHGQLAKGEGVISLARAFKYAGCSNVLMSLWQADDQSTAQIMQDFYRYLKAGKGKDDAIRQAKLDYLESNARNHPFFWGAFVLIGDDLPMEQPSNRIWYMAVLAVLIATAGYVYWQRKRSR